MQVNSPGAGTETLCGRSAALQTVLLIGLRRGEETPRDQRASACTAPFI